MPSGTGSVTPTADVLRRRSGRSDRVHGTRGSGPIGDHRSRFAASLIGSAGGVRRSARHVTSPSKDTDVGGRRNAPGQRTRNGVPTRPRIPRNGVVAVIIMVGPLSVSSCRSRPPLPCSGSRRVNTIGTAIRSATPFLDFSGIAFPNRFGTVRGSSSRVDSTAACGVPVVRRIRARRRPGTEPVPGPRGRTAATASRVPPRPPSARRPRRRSARCPRRSRHRRPRASRCGRRPRAG